MNRCPMIVSIQVIDKLICRIVSELVTDSKKNDRSSAIKTKCMASVCLHLIIKKKVHVTHKTTFTVRLRFLNYPAAFT